MEQYAGLDVSLESTSICVVDAAGRVVRESKVPSEPDALVAWFQSHGVAMVRIGLEAGRCRNGFSRDCNRPDCLRS